MATFTAPSATARSARSQPKVAAGSISSLRIRPFVRVNRNAPKQQFVVRAAEPEAATVAEEEYSFSFTDAKKGNEYQASDVEAALRYYEGEGEAPGNANSEFVENLFGTEDASFFDEFDNNDAYDDEFIAAGIPEAAPKQRQGAPRGVVAEKDGDGEEVDLKAVARDMDRMKEAEERMVLSAELQETGLDKEKDEDADAKAVGPAVWDWMSDIQADLDDEELNAVANSRGKTMSARVLAALPTDEEVFYDLRHVNIQDLDEGNRGLIEFMLDDFDVANEVDAIPDDPEELTNVPDLNGLTDEDVERIDALLNEDLALPELDMSDLEDIPVVEDDGTTIPEGAVEKYVESLRTAEAIELSEDEINAAFGEDSVQLVDLESEEPVSLDDLDLSEPVIEPLAESELEIEEIQEEDESTAAQDAFRAELLALRSMPLPTWDEREDDMEVLDEYVKATEAFWAAEDTRRAELSAAVARGELTQAEADSDYVDVETELLMPEDDEEDRAADAEDDFEDDEENWQERIIELTRVTKVVKGGKLMGFRCTAVVGNGNGLVGVGCQAGREIATAVKRALVDAKKNVVQVPLVGAGTIPHRVEAKFNAARCVVLPAADGTGVLAGGSIRSVLELAGVQNVLAKRIGCRSLLNNARCAVAALEQLRTLQDVSKARGVPMSRLLLNSK